MDECVAAWLAGLIDGEGSIMLTNHKSPTQAQGRKRPIVSISNCDRPLLEAVVGRTGMGRIYLHRRAPKENQKRDSYTCRFTSTEQRLVLPKVLPWLVTKQPQAILLLEALAIKDQLKVATGRTVADRDKLCARRDEIQLTISRLNRRGRLTGGDAI